MKQMNDSSGIDVILVMSDNSYVCEGKENVPVHDSTTEICIEEI